MGFWTAPESNPPDASGNPIFLISEFLLITGMKKKIIKEEKTPTLCVSYFIISHYLSYFTAAVVLHLLTSLVSVTARRVLLAKERSWVQLQRWQDGDWNTRRFCARTQANGLELAARQSQEFTEHHVYIYIHKSKTKCYVYDLLVS